MRKLIVEEWMSLDGHISDKNGELDFFTSLSPGENRHSDDDQLKFLEEVDTIILGRKTYELFVEFWPDASPEQEIIAPRLNEIHKVVFSNTLKDAPWGKWKPAEIMSGNAVENVKKLKSMHGNNIVLWGSISVAGELMKHKLVDEFHFQLCPVVTGGGRPFFPREAGDQKLSLINAKSYPTGTVLVKYRL